MADTTVYIDFDAAGGGDGSISSPYNTLSAWETAEVRDLTAEGIHTVYIKGLVTTSTTNLNIGQGAWTTDSTHYVHYKPWPGEEHDGVDSTVGAGWRCNSGGTYAYIIQNLGPTYSIFEGLIVWNTANGSQEVYGVKANKNNVTLRAILARAGSKVIAPFVNGTVENCVLHQNDTTSTGYVTGTAGGYHTGIKYLNNTILGVENTFAVGIQNGANDSGWTVKNNVVIGATATTGVEYSEDAGASWTEDSNAGALAAYSGATNYQQITTADFNNYAGGDYTPAASGGLDGTGTATGTPATDIIGTARANPPSIGAFEYVGGTSITTVDFTGIGRGIARGIGRGT